MAKVIYLDKSRAVDARVADLLSRMTLEEKVGQLCQINGQDDAEYWLDEHHVGSFLHIIGETAQALQARARQTRLGIPLIFGIDAIHGHAFWESATVFPTQLAVSCSWNPEIVEQMGRITAREVAPTGLHWTFSPVLGTVRDLRWGRVNETFGEDPYLIGVLGAAIVKGYQGDDLSAPDTILACAKHYAGYPDTQGGRDSSEGDTPRRKLRSILLKPFHAAVKAGCATMMAAYHAIDGVPCSANKWLLTDVLRDEWGFDGFVVSDWKNINHMHVFQMVSPTIEDAVRRVLEAGNDMAMNTQEFPEAAVKLVKRGELDEAVIDESCRRVLRLKFLLGLFDGTPYDTEDGRGDVIGCAEHRAAALEAAYQSIVLLKNEDGLLPLKDDVKRIAVIGPNADDLLAQLGDWTTARHHQDEFMRSDEHYASVLRGIRERVSDGVEVTYHRGCDGIDPADEDISGAVEVARAADVAIVVIGDNNINTGEARDRGNLDLSGAQQALVEAIYATGKPVVVVLLNGKPLSIPWVAENIPAIVEAFNPGMRGGEAVAGILFGDRNPQGKLTISFPYHVGQQPVFYNQVPGWHGGRYVDLPSEPLFAFGYGLSYTTYTYSNLSVKTPELHDGETLAVEVNVKNTGTRDGVEIVQLYINDIYSSVTTPVKELQAFQRVELAAGESKTVRLEVPFEQLAIVDAEAQFVFEPGEFEVMVGSSSRDKDLLKARFTVT